MRGAVCEISLEFFNADSKCAHAYAGLCMQVSVHEHDERGWGGGGSGDIDTIWEGFIFSIITLIFPLPAPFWVRRRHHSRSIYTK